MNGPLPPYPISDKSILTLFPDCRFRVVEARQTIFEQNSTAASLYYIVSGRVQISRVFRGKKELPLATLKKGDFLGEMAMLTGNRRSARARALTRVKMLEVPRRSFMQLLDKTDPLASCLGLHLAALLAQRLGRVFHTFTDPRLPEIIGRPHRQVDVARILREMYGHCVA